MRRQVFLLATVVAIAGSASARGDDTSDRIDKLFARWDTKTTPGCALGVIRDGKLVCRKNYGMAELEHGVPIGPDTVFHVASVSKQFTAFAVLLLEKDGKLSLDDDVRKHLPEVPDFGKTITLRHLLHHTSGLRDQWELLELAGWRSEDVITDDDILGLVRRQRKLNFDPGAEHLYCNTGYTLAALVVGKVSGQPFREFARKRIFEPLGMKRTSFPANHQAIVPGRAQSYYPVAGGRYAHEILSYSNAGATSLLTTVEDLAAWDRNFHEPKVGDAELLERMHEAGKLNDGKAIDYALGVVHGEHRGLRIVEHSGSDAAFRCTLLRFPSERFSVIVLSNAGESSPTDLARRVADVHLADKLKPVSAKPMATDRKEVAVEPALLAAYAGDYRLPSDVVVTVRNEGGKLTTQRPGGSKGSLVPASERRFNLAGRDITLTFDPPAGGKSPRVEFDYGDEKVLALRYERPTLTAERAEDFVGDYRSEELNVIYTVTRRDATLSIRHPRGTEELRLVEDDRFRGGSVAGRVTFVRGKEGRVTGFRIDGGRIRGVEFDRVRFTPVR